MIIICNQTTCLKLTMDDFEYLDTSIIGFVWDFVVNMILKDQFKKFIPTKFHDDSSYDSRKREGRYLTCDL